MSGGLGGAAPPIPPKTAKNPGLRHWARAGGRQRGELRSVGQGFVTCLRAGIAGDPPRLASTRARRSGGGFHLSSRLAYSRVILKFGLWLSVLKQSTSPECLSSRRLYRCPNTPQSRSEEHTSELQSLRH